MRKTFYHIGGRKDSVFTLTARGRVCAATYATAGATARATARFPARLTLGVCLLACLGSATATNVCLAVPGSGTAQMWPTSYAVAGTYSRWTIRYTATEDFDWLGGIVTIQIPSGWSAPQVVDSTVVGYLRIVINNPDDLDSLRVSGDTVRLYLGGKLFRDFDEGEYFDLIYGASSSYARTQTSAPDTVEFTVRSQPDGGVPVPLTSGSPSVMVVPGATARIAILLGGSEAGALNLTADDNSTLLSAQGTDTYGNVTGGVACTWGLTAPVGNLSGGKDSTNSLDARSVGTGYVTAYDDFAHTDSTGLVTVTHGAYARLDVAQPDTAVAGGSFSVSVAALDADGNVVTSGAGSSATLQLSAWRDSLAAAPGSGTLSVPTLGLAAGVGSVGETYLVSESIFVRARDVSDTTRLDFGPWATFVKPGPPDQVELWPDTLFAGAGVQSAFTLFSRDAHGNASPVSSAQTFYLWKNSPTGEFRQGGGSQQIFDINLPADSSQVSFDYYDTKTQTVQVAAMDVDSNSPAFPPATATVVVTHGAADTLIVSGVADPFTAGRQSGVAVEARDGFGNRVTDYSGEVEFSTSDSNPETALPGDYSFVSPDSGMHVFPSSVTLTDAGEQWVSASDRAAPSLDGAQAGITVLAAGCDTLLLSVSDNPVSADEWLDLELEAMDEYGNRAAGYSGVVRFSSSDTSDSTVLPGDYQFLPADNGLHVFTGAVRLTQAGTQSISVVDTSAAATHGEATGISVSAGTARSVILFPPDSFQVNAGGGQVLTATARDAFGNARSNEPTTIVIKDTADGVLADDPGNPNDTSGGVTIQTGNTDASGEITVMYTAPGVAGRRDTVDAYCSTVGHGSVPDAIVTSTPSGATALRILPVEPVSDTAAAAVPLTIDAVDSFGNIDITNAGLVRVSASSPTARVSVDGGASWSTGNSDSLALAAGSTQARLKLKDSKTGSLTLLAEDTGSVLISALKNSITFRHALPAGAIAVSADRDTLVSDGGSSASVAAGPVYDAYANNVGSGELVTVSSLLCDVVASDMDTSAAGVQLATGGDGKVSFAVRAGIAAGTDTVTVRSVAGTARGSVVVTLLEAQDVQVELEPDTLHVTAGAQGAFTLTSRDVHGNASPVSLTQRFRLWKSSPTGEFRRHGGSQQILEVELQADSSRVSFDYYDTAARVCQIAAMDVDANLPAFPPATAEVSVTHGPADTLHVSGVSDPLTAGAQSDVAVEARDGFGNRVTDYSGELEFASSDTNPGTVLPGAYSFAPSDSGRRVFPLSVTLTEAGEQWVRAFDTAVPSLDGAQAGITVVGAACDTLVLRVSDNPVSGDAWLDLDVEALDGYGNRATGYSGVVRFSSSDTGDSTVLPADYKFVPSDNGLHVFADAVRLTQAGTQSISAEDTLQVGTDGIVTGISVFAGAARSVMLFPPGSFQVNAGGTQVLKATVRDAFGNARAGEPASVVIKDAPDGLLDDDPGNPNNTSGGLTMQTGNTDSAGEITVLYRGPAAAGLSDTVDAYCTTVGHGSVADVRVISTPAGATALRVLPVEPLADTAGARFSVTVEAMDSFGNVDASQTSFVRVTASSPTARVSIDGGVSWSAGNSDSLALASGSTQTRLRLTDTKTGNLTLLAEDAGGVLISALKANVTFGHALPAGVVALSLDRDTLIADGSSSVTATAGPVYDAYGNNAGAGELVTVSTQLSDVVASDMDTSTAGLQLVTGDDGRVSFVLRAGPAAGADTVSVRSVLGTASGSAALTLLDAPHIEYVGGTLAPLSFNTGQTISFSMELENDGGARVHLLPTSSISFTDGNDGFFTAVFSDTVVLPAGQSAVAGFAPTLVPSQLDAGAYSPVLSLSGLDQTGRAFSQTLSPGPNTIQVVSMSIVSILAPPAVSRGADDVGVQMAVKNDGDVALEVTSLGLAFSSPGHTYVLAGTTLPDTLAGGETRVFGFLVDVDAFAPLGDCTIDGFAAGTAGGAAVSAPHADSPAVWAVQSSASLAYSAGSLSRASVSLGQTHSFSVVLENFGTAAVQLDTTGTSLRFGAPGNEYTTSLPAPMLLPGGASTVVSFRPARVSAAIPTGIYSVEVSVAGVESGAPFADTLSSGSDSVRVDLPAVLECLSISPDTVSTGCAAALSVVLRNSGGATAEILPQTRMSFGSTPIVYESFAGDSVLIEGDSTRAVGFIPVAVDTAFATGQYALSLSIKSVENGVPEDTVLTPGSDSLLVQRRARLDWVAASLAPARVTRGQAVGFALDLSNSGDAAAVVEPSLCELGFGDGENEFLAMGQGPTLVIPARGLASVSLVSDTVPPAMAAHTYSVKLTLRGTENGSALFAEVSSPQGELAVQSPPSLRYAAGSLAPRVVAQEQTAGFTLEVENEGDATLLVADTTQLSLGSLTDTVDCASGCQIQGHSTGVLTFKTIRMDSLMVAKGDYPVLVSVTGTDWNGLGFAGSVSTAPDSVSVTEPGDLRVYSTGAVSPNAPFVDTLQAFSVEVEVENVGEENALDVLVSMSSSGGSAVASPVSFGEVPGGGRKKMAFSVTAPGAPGLDVLTSRIESATGKLSGLPLSVANALDDTAAVTIQTPALLSVSASVSAPAGAADGTVSTDQTFKLRAVAQNLGQGVLVPGGTLTAELPAGHVLLSPAAQAFTPGTAVEWSVRAPSAAQPAAPALISISSLPTSRNTGSAADTFVASRTISLTAVMKAELSLDAGIVAPVDATDGSLRLDTQFRVQAVTSNLGTAAAAGSGRLALSLPSGYSFAGGQAAEQDFAVGSPVTWDVVSPSASSPIQYINVVISQPPPDENADAPASVLVGTKNIAVYAESKHMIAEVLSLVEAPEQVAAGDNSVEMMLVRIANPEELGEGSTIGLRALTVYLRGVDYARLSDPSAAVAGVGVWRYSSGVPVTALGATSSVGANPVRVELSPEADTLAPGEADTLLIVVDVSSTPQTGGIILELDDASAFEAFERSSGELIAVLSPDGSDFQQVLSAPSRLFTAVHNHPNPFRAGFESTTISYYLQDDSRVSLRIFTLDGKPVLSRTYSAEEPQGRHGLREIQWDGRNGDGRVVLNGVYICKLEAAGTDATFKIAVAK